MRRPRSRLRSVAALAAGMAVVAALLVALPAGAKASCSQVTADGPCGMNLDAAWAHFTKGDPHVLITYIEGGINWHLSDAKTLHDSIYVNWHETPVPCTGASMAVAGSTEACARVYSHSFSDYDVNHDGVVNAADWEHDPRVTDSNHNGYIDPEDLIAAFSDGIDHDGNGYPSDISGWDFYDNQNDPATYDSTYDHSDGQMMVLHHECPKCTILPVKAGDEALDRTDDLAKAWLYSADIGASVVTSVTADLGYSSFGREAIDYLEHRGIAIFESSNDFDSTDHQGGMFHPYVVPGNVVVASSDGSKWVRSDLTSWGPHNILSAATSGGSTSESTPTLAGVTALLLSWGRLAAQRGLISSPLSGPEAEQVLEATARRVTDPTLPWPGSRGGWNEQYGYGIPNLLAAMKAVAAGKTPPVAHIDSPDWYQLFDPTTSSSVAVDGTIKASRPSGFSWVLQAGLGGQPTKWFSIGQGQGQGSFIGTLGTLDLSNIPASFWQTPFHLSQTKEAETVDQYTVTLRLKVTDANGNLGRDRRAISVYHDSTWLHGFPLKMPASGESQPALVDLQGTGRLDLVFGDADGLVHAIDPATRKELPGWPVHTDAVHVLVKHPSVDPGHEPILSDVAVGDLDHTGHLDVVATTLDGHVYAFDAQGQLLPGWPQAIDTGVKPPPIPRPALQYTRLPVQGATASPVLFDLAGNNQLEVIQAGWDGRIHAWKPDGTELPGWPVHVTAPPGPPPPPGYVLIDDRKLDAPPAIAFLQGRQMPPDVVERAQYTWTQGSGVQPGPSGFVYAYGADGSLLPGWPARMPGTVEYYGSAQEFVTEGRLIGRRRGPTGSGLGPDDVAVGPVFSPPYLIDGAGNIAATYRGASGGGQQQDAPVAFTTSGAFGKVGGVMTFAQPETGGSTLATALLQPNSGGAIAEFEGAYPAAGGNARPGYPAPRQGIDFLGEPIVTDVVGDGQDEVIDGGDANALTAYDSVGNMAAGFPKWTTGWTVYSPSSGDLFSSGKVDLVQTAREGYVFAWSTPGLESADTEWWRAQHDEYNTGMYEAQTRPPGAVTNASWALGRATATFVQPGQAWYSGQAPSFVVTFEPGGRTERPAGSGAAGSRESFSVPSGTTAIRIQPVNRAGLLGPARWLRG